MIVRRASAEKHDEAVQDIDDFEYWPAKHEGHSFHSDRCRWLCSLMAISHMPPEWTELLKNNIHDLPTGPSPVQDEEDGDEPMSD